MQKLTAAGYVALLFAAGSFFTYEMVKNRDQKLPSFSIQTYSKEKSNLYHDALKAEYDKSTLVETGDVEKAQQEIQRALCMKSYKSRKSSLENIERVYGSKVLDAAASNLMYSSGIIGEDELNRYMGTMQALTQSANIQMVLVSSFVRNLASEYERKKEADEIASQWRDVNGRSLSGEEIYNGNVRRDKSGTMMRIYTPEPLSPSKNDVTSQRQERVGSSTVYTQRITPGASQEDRRREWQQEQVNLARQDVQRMTQAAGNAAQNLGSALGNLLQQK